jgi:hypothetical protein
MLLNINTYLPRLLQFNQIINHSWIIRLETRSDNVTEFIIKLKLQTNPDHWKKSWEITNAHCNFAIRKFNIIHCQLRNEASNLKAHLFNDFLSDNTNCPNCSGSLEDNNHFLLICPKFNNLRFILLDFIQTLIPNNNKIDINIDLLLHGNRSFSYDLNTEIFQAVHKFIIDTHRFI